MTFNRIVSRISNALGTVRSASHVAAALEANRRPEAVHLRRLGIDPHAFTTFGHG
jgi:hypothetical protein